MIETQIRPLRIPFRYPQEKGLVLYMPMERIFENKVMDFSPFRNHGKIFGAQWVDGKFGKALSFDGVDDYVEIPHSVSLNIPDQITILLWVKINNKTTFQRIIGKAINWGESGNYFVGVYDNRIYWDFYGNGERKMSVLSINSLDISVFHHFATVYNGNQMIIYLDGKKSSFRTIGKVNLDTNSDNLYLGGNINYNRFNGTIGEVRIYSKALNTNEVKYHFESTRAIYGV